jgi:FlaA1/EpsC-like NDP-sugar epimerase
MLGADFCFLIFALWASFSLRLGEMYWPSDEIIPIILISPVVALIIFKQSGLYSVVIRYIGFHALWAIVKAVSLYSILIGLLVFLSGVAWFPRSVIFINWVLLIIMIGGSRLAARWWLSDRQINPLFADKKENIKNNVIIYGAGSAGVQLVKSLDYSKEFRPVAFIDDDAALDNHYVNGLPVYQVSELAELIEEYAVSHVLMAIPSASKARRNEIVLMLESYPVRVLTIPGLDEIAQGRVKIDDIREVEVDDLLGRDQVAPNKELMGRNISDKVVMVTGAGGSIGAELCRQILSERPAKLILYDHNEYALYEIEKELENRDVPKGGKTEPVVVPLLGSVCDTERMTLVCNTFKVNTIFHAAAYKHVPMIERNPVEAITNNILGTYSAAQAAMNSGVETFVLISTDKAVRPTNTMGASKRFAELILQGLSKEHPDKTRFTMVRFGNVLGSSGSVIPLFRDQIRKGGPVTVTDPAIIRYFMTIPEAAQLVIQAGAMGKGGDVFVLDMGEPVKILDLARRLIHLSGLEVKDDNNPDGDIAISFTGLRPGEKLFEELLIDENVLPTEHALIMRAEEEVLPWDVVSNYINEFKQAAVKNEQTRIRELLLKSVNGYKPQCGIEDLTYKFATDSPAANDDKKS